jgi:hypothetical protein
MSSIASNGEETGRSGLSAWRISPGARSSLEWERDRQHRCHICGPGEVAGLYSGLTAALVDALERMDVSVQPSMHASACQGRRSSSEVHLEGDARWAPCNGRSHGGRRGPGVACWHRVARGAAARPNVSRAAANDASSCSVAADRSTSGACGALQLGHFAKLDRRRRLPWRCCDARSAVASPPERSRRGR